jgi:hypothetical protein
MAEIKDKIVTAESLSALHEYNKNKYMDKADIISISKGGTGATTAEAALTNLGITATATELNFCDGVTSNIQTQLNGKANSSHGTHVSYGTSTSALGTASAGSANTVSRSDHVHALPALTSCTGTLTVAKGGTGATDAATARTNLGITPENIGASHSSHNHSGHVIEPASINLEPVSGANHGGYIDFNYNGEADDYTSRIIEESSGMLAFISANGIKLDAGTYGTELPASGNVGRIFFKKVNA